MINDLKKVFMIIVMMFMFFYIGTSVFSYANATSNELVSTTDVDNLFKTSDDLNDGIVDAKKTVGNTISNYIMLLKIVGSGITIIMLLVLSCKYMMGSIEEKAEIKKHAVVYVVGALAFFGAYGILTIVQTVLTGINIQ